ncbi:type II secretion system protein H [Shimia isoporae]|uniref:Type II secretion system protein H n=1 Tax=Shimia isoporae TaxID=647720 RepID=A0A4V2Q211_9RHOB|nr:prepilin-type N-terminal cleavage/methylation domain-containing protein [Shimia isoporae]TCK99862.1 type II secretion system protein H [Shimia isoporae]
MKPADAGVSLIELLVVVAVLSVLAVGISLPLRNDGNNAPSDAARFQSLFENSRTLAIHKQQLRGLRIEPRGVALMARTQGGWEQSSQIIRWRGRVAFQNLGPIGAGQSFDSPEVTFLPNGQTTAFQIRFFSSESGSASCESDGWAEVTCSQN